ncbi:MAG: hypothetical protein ACRYG7_09010 [Janthinobacterium lividum]
MKWLSFICLVVLLNCSSKQPRGAICEKQAYLTNELRNSSLAKGRGNNLLIFETFQDKKINHYFLEVVNNTYVLRSDSLQYAMPSRALRENPVAYVAALNEKLAAFGIREYDGQPDGLGTLLKLYMTNGEVIIQCADTRLLSYPALLTELKNSKKLCDNWYITRE